MIFEHEDHTHKEPPGRGVDRRLMVFIVFIAILVLISLSTGLTQGIINFFRLIF